MLEIGFQAEGLDFGRAQGVQGLRFRGLGFRV